MIVLFVGNLILNELFNVISLKTCKGFHVFLLHIDPGQAVKIGRGISEYNLDRGRVEWVRFVTPTRRRWMSNYYITRCTGSSISWRSDELEKRCGRENQHPKRLGSQTPGWAAQENGKETLLWLYVRSPTPSHSKTFSNRFEPFQIKWEVYFSKELCRSSLLCRSYDSACMCVCIVDHGYTIFPFHSNNSH